MEFACWGLQNWKMADRTPALAYLTSGPSASHLASPLHKPGQWKQARENNLPLETASWWQDCPGSQEQGCFTRSAPPVTPWKEPCETRPTGGQQGHSFPSRFSTRLHSFSEETAWVRSPICSLLSTYDVQNPVRCGGSFETQTKKTTPVLISVWEKRHHYMES